MNSITLFELDDPIPTHKVVDLGDDYVGGLDLNDILTDSEVDDLVESFDGMIIFEGTGRLS